MECQCFAFFSSHTVVSMVAAGSLLAWLDPLTCCDPELCGPEAQLWPGTVTWAGTPLCASLRGQCLAHPNPHPRPTDLWLEVGFEMQPRREEASSHASPECELNK